MGERKSYDLIDTFELALWAVTRQALNFADHWSPFYRHNSERLALTCCASIKHFDIHRPLQCDPEPGCLLRVYLM